MDIVDLLNEIPKTSIVIAFLPTYAGGYEKLYKRMEEVFDWNRPAYIIIDSDRKVEIIKQLTTFSYIYIDDKKIPDLPLVAKLEPGEDASHTWRRNRSKFQVRRSTVPRPNFLPNLAPRNSNSNLR